MKKLILIILVLAIVALPLASLTGCSTRTERLIVYNWADYIDKSLLEDFVEYYKEKTGKNIKVTYSTYDTNETMMTKILNNDADVDLVCPSEYSIMRLANAGKLQKINKEKLENMDVFNPQIIESVDATFEDQDYNLNDYFVPYMWGTLGVMYTRVDRDGNEIISDEMAEEAGWGLLWNSWYDENGELTSSDVLNGKILMKDSVRDAYCAAVFYMRQMGTLPEKYQDWSAQDLINCTDDEMIDAAEKVMQAQKASGCLKGYEVDLGKDDMINGTAYVNLAWSGDAMYAIEEADAEGVELGYIAPTAGGNVWFDGWCIPTTCKNLEAAEIFIEWISQPYVSVYNMYEIGYSSACDRMSIISDADAVLAIADSYQWTDDPKLQKAYKQRAKIISDIWEDEDKVAAIQTLLDEALENPDTMWDTEDEEGNVIEGTLRKLDELIIGADENDDFYGAYDAVYDMLFDEEWLALIRYPEDFSELGVMKDFGDKNSQIVKMWDSVKASGGWDWTITGICIGVCALLVGGFVLIYVLKTKVFYGRYRKV